jgi:hypothetical protein
LFGPLAFSLGMIMGATFAGFVAQLQAIVERWLP